MASDTNICFENLVGLGFGEIDIDMEVKSEQDSEDEDNFMSNECDEFDVEFIIPEQRKPESINEELTEFVSNNVCNADTFQSNIDNCGIDIEDEPEVEIDEVTVRQELVEVALDPSLLLYVNKDKNSVCATTPQNTNVVKLVENQYSISDKRIEIENKYSDDHSILSALLDKQNDLFPSLIPSSERKKNGSITAALRKVKRKSHREPLEPLNEIECSSHNINNTSNIDGNRSNIEKLKCDKANVVDNEENNDDRNDIFCDAPSPCNSDSDFKEQKRVGMILKRKRGRPRLKSNTYVEKFLTKRKVKRKKPGRKIKTVRLKHKNDKVKLIVEREKSENEIQDNESQMVNISENLSATVGKHNENRSKRINNVRNRGNENMKKSKKIRTKNKPSIFDEIKMDYTVLNENETKEKPKRVRKRDKRSREIAAHNKPESFDCTECGRKFKEKSHLATHARAHIDIRNFKCNKCGSLFKTKTNLFFHMKTHSDAPFTCDKCNKTYPERKTLMRHIRVVHSSQNIYSCDQCGREFKSMHNLNLHYTLHTGVKPFTCTICNKSFVYKSTYIAHSKGHEADNSFNCELCPKTFNNKAEFRRLCNHHSEARPWLCTVCGKGYPLKGTLKNHMKTHEAEKPFKCTVCPKSFMKKQSFECHSKMHAGERPQFMCDQCSQSYFNVFALKRHYLKHTSERKFVCEVCHKAFWMKDALKVHMRTHSSVKLFPCVQCPKAFAHKHTLDAHLRTHLDVEPYSCNVCQKTFIHKYNLARHERQHITSPTVPVLPVPPPIVHSGHQTVPISIMMLPGISTSPSTTLHSYTVNAACL